MDRVGDVVVEEDADVIIDTETGFDDRCLSGIKADDKARKWESSRTLNSSDMGDFVAAMEQWRLTVKAIRCV